MTRPATSKPRGALHRNERLESQDDVRHSTPTEGFMRLLEESGARFELYDVSEHNRRKTPSFAETIARHSLPKSEATTRNEP